MPAGWILKRRCHTIAPELSSELSTTLEGTKSVPNGDIRVTGCWRERAQGMCDTTPQGAREAGFATPSLDVAPWHGTGLGRGDHLLGQELRQVASDDRVRRILPEVDVLLRIFGQVVELPPVLL